IHAVSHFYETMLRAMRDSAGDAGEFYTPRPVVRFIIDRLAPKLGERIRDPACGTCGFLVEAYEHLREQARSPELHRRLQDSLMGIEKKSMPYLLGVMNLLLHGIEYPNIVERNALSSNIRQIRDAERVDVVATNPPFGGEEERGILNNFSEACEPDREEPCTREVWYYELPLPEGRNNYSKTKPLQFEEFAGCIAWWDKREENERAWKVPVEQILANECNLDIKNPNAKGD